MSLAKKQLTKFLGNSVNVKICQIKSYNKCLELHTSSISMICNCLSALSLKIIFQPIKTCYNAHL